MIGLLKCRRMSVLESAIEDLKALPHTQLDEAFRYIQSPKNVVHIQKEEVLSSTFGCLNESEASDWE